jgi:glucose-1-phosphate cytidylyltransferase
MQVVILCGGKGTRAYPVTTEIPKALMRVDGVPILEQVIRIYAAQGFSEFILSCGYLMDQIVGYFDRTPLPLRIQCVNTGEDADTGDRIWRLRELLGPEFHATYCDGLGDVDLAALTQAHRAHGAGATVTAVPLRSQYGILQPGANDRVVGFSEKPVLSEYWINGGFFLLNREVFDVWQGHNLEKEVLPRLAELGLLQMYRHQGFWRSMDTYKDQQELNGLWRPFGREISKQLAEALPTTSAWLGTPAVPASAQGTPGMEGNLDA